MKNVELVTFEEREHVPTKEVGTEIKIKVADIDAIGKSIMAKRNKDGMSPYIRINAINYDMKKGTSYTHTYDKDHKNGVYYGIVTGFYPDGNPKWFKIHLNESEHLNLNNDLDIKKWVVLRMSSVVDGSPLCSGRPRYEVYDSEIEAQGKINKVKAIQKSLGRCDKLKGANLIDFARFLGLDVAPGTTEKVLNGIVGEYALDDPIDFNKKFDDEKRRVYETFFNAIRCGVVKHEYSRGYMYKQVVLGSGEEDSVIYLSRHGDILTAVQIDVDDKDIVRNNIINVEKAISKVTEKKEEEKVAEEAEKEYKDEGALE